MSRRARSADSARPCGRAEEPQRAPDGVAHRAPGVERGVRVLEDQLHPPPQGHRPPLRGPGQIARLVGHGAAGRGAQPREGPGQRGLAAARLADECEDLAAPDLEGDPVHGTGAAVVDGDVTGRDGDRRVLGHDGPRTDLALAPLAHEGETGVVQPRHARQQPLRVRLLGRREQPPGGRRLHHAARLQHTHLVGQVRDDAQIVTHQHCRQAQFVAQGGDQVQHAPLGDDVQAGRRLVEDQHLGAGGEGHGEGDALLLAAGQLVRIAAGQLGGARQPDLVEQIGDGDVAARLRDLLARRAWRGSAPGPRSGRPWRPSGRAAAVARARTGRRRPGRPPSPNRR